MSSDKYFTTCNGSTVIVKAAGYIALGEYGLTELPKHVERMTVACGGGRPPLYHYLAGRCACGSMHFVERAIRRPNTPSNHKCDSRCVNARGRNCECSCGGQNHGAN